MSDIYFEHLYLLVENAKTVDVAQYIYHKDVKLKQILVLLNLNVCKLEKKFGSNAV